MLKKTCLLVLERNQALAQPIQLLAQHFYVVRTADANAFRQFAFAQAMDSLIEIANRPRQQVGEAGDHQQGRRNHCQQLPDDLVTCFRRGGFQRSDLLRDQLIGQRVQGLRACREIGEITLELTAQFR